MNKQPIVYGFALKRSIKNTKITFAVLLLFILQGIVGNVYAQEKKISISVKNEKLETVLRMVEKQTNYLFFYDSDEINKQQRITINQTNSSLKDVLDAVASKTNLSYTIKGRHIILAKKPNVSSANKDGRASGSEKKITGIVKDEADLPVVGANVMVPRTKKGVITDMNGNFSLEVAAGDEVEISYLGYTTQKIKISAQNFLNVVLREDAKSLNEVVVVGYGSVKKSDLTGSVASVSNTTLLRGGKTNSAGALQGELSGVTITRSNNKPGGGYDIKIRGINSITASSSPLIVIDGVPGGNLDFVNPDDIEKIELFTTLAHEGYPGHLYQTVKSYEYGLSPIRSILNYGGYTEGWATYVEMLSYAYAGIDSDAARFLKCNKDFSLSLYAASDIGIHYYGWDFNKLCDFWKDYGITDVNALKEVQRLIISSPANYLKYYVGYLQIEKLKDSQKETLGGDYSDMEFHKAFLKIGPAPFHIIEKYINNPGIS